ncbi:MAG: glucose-6-phosphate isomerase [Syntrophomonadaceae bacterium]|nr:glucose-6-phosphate isomerase [Syntrophomonadaceae bacterium]
MDELMVIDTGHLIEKKGGEFSSQIKDTFSRFQDDLREKRNPITLSFLDEETIAELKSIAKKLREKYENILILGIGGSALGTKAMLQFLYGCYYQLEQHKPRIFILDNIDPATISQLERILDFRKTALIYTSKSGSTAETAANFIYFYNKYKEAGGDERDIVIICDPGDNGINRIAKKLGCYLLRFPKNLQGRYSVMSPVGFLPAELAGIDCRGFLDGAGAVHKLLTTKPSEENPLLVLGGAIYEYFRAGRTIHVLFNYSDLLQQFGLWFMQLWAESLGKRVTLTGEEVKIGATPLSCLGTTDQHSLLQLFKEGAADKIFGFIRIHHVPQDPKIRGAFPSEVEYAYFDGHTMQEQLYIEQMATEMSLVHAGHPCYRITVREASAVALGGLFYLYEALTVFVANLFNVNPYDQPGVEEGKKIAYALLGREDHLPRQKEYQEMLDNYLKESRVFIVK